MSTKAIEPDEILGPNEFAGRAFPGSSNEALEELEALAHLLDTRWRIPGTGIRFGADALVGLVPGLGDAAMGAISAYLIYRAHQLGAPGHVKARMVGNVVLDTLVGSVPILGSVFDVAFRANRRNMRLLRAHFERERIG